MAHRAERLRDAILPPVDLIDDIDAGSFAETTETKVVLSDEERQHLRRKLVIDVLTKAEGMSVESLASVSRYMDTMTRTLINDGERA